MGIFKCERHGFQGFVEVCPHVSDALDQGQILPRKRFLGVEVCEGCAERHQLSRFPPELPLGYPSPECDQYLLLNADSQCHCIECVATTALQFARDHGQPDPFVAYERTLTFLQRDTVERLKTGLLKAFDIRQSIVERGTRALWVEYGAVTRPLTITVYYITTSEAQNALFLWLNEFFSKLERRQRRVLFYRAECWSEDPHKPGLWSRGPEELLLRDETESPARRLA